MGSHSLLSQSGKRVIGLPLLLHKLRRLVQTPSHFLLKSNLLGLLLWERWQTVNSTLDIYPMEVRLAVGPQECSVREADLVRELG